MASQDSEPTGSNTARSFPPPDSPALAQTISLPAASDSHPSTVVRSFEFITPDGPPDNPVKRPSVDDPSRTGDILDLVVALPKSVDGMRSWRKSRGGGMSNTPIATASSTAISNRRTCCSMAEDVPTSRTSAWPSGPLPTAALQPQGRSSVRPVSCPPRAGCPADAIRPRRRRLLALRDTLQPAHRPSSVSGGHSPRNAGPSRRQRPGPAAAAQSWHHNRPRNDLSRVPRAIRPLCNSPTTWDTSCRASRFWRGRWVSSSAPRNGAAEIAP